MPRTPARFTLADFRRAALAVKSVGGVSVRFLPSGEVVIEQGEKAPESAALDEKATEWAM